MCGISGIVLFSKESQDRIKFEEETLSRMNETMKLRGPDDSGIIISSDNKVGFTHRRLKIIDLSEKAHQPMSNLNQTISIIFNGEIFNYQEIRDRLKLLNYTFNSTSDTEVIVYAFAEWGIECIHQFNGQFAIAIYDQRNNKKDFYLIRDRFGIKPLHYSWVNSTNGKFLVFGSTIPSILESKYVKKTPNIAAISDYLSFRYALGIQTFFKEIYRLLPGHYMYLDLNKQTCEIKRYYKLYEKIKQNSSISFNNAKKEIFSALKRATQLRLISDVPFGAYLSGGVDSSAIIVLMSQLHDESIRTYTIGFKEQNEFEYAKMIADQYQTTHKEILQSPNKFFDLMKFLIMQRGEPLGVPNEIPLYEMSNVLKNDITVVLSGEGADEIFMGYGKIFRLPLDYSKLKYPLLPSFLKKRLFPDIYQKYGSLVINDFIDLFIHRYSYISFEEKLSLFQTSALEEIKASRNGASEFAYYKSIIKPYFDEIKKQDLETQISYVFELLHLPNLLQRVDNSTLATSVEGRVPFVDHNLVETTLALPRIYKLKEKSFFHRLKSLRKSSNQISEVHDIPKFLLKEIFKEYLPNKVLYRKKLGFPVPLGEFFNLGLKTYIKELLLSDNSLTKEIFVKDKIISLLDGFNGTWESGLLLWQLLNIEIWFRDVVGYKKEF